MRVRLLLVPAIVLAIVAATGNSCAGSERFTAGGTDVGGGSNPGSTPQPDGGDSGIPPIIVDGGNPCDTQILPQGTVTVNDNCIAPGITTQTTATIQTTGCNNAKIFLNDGFNCSGVLTGPSNNFDGGCSVLPCGGPLPGTLLCTQQNQVTCTIQVCSGTTCP
jgi:hypothetical protein